MTRGPTPRERQRPLYARWTPEQDSLLRKLNADGLTASQIAAHFENFSRNAIIGRAHRLGLVLANANGPIKNRKRKHLADSKKPATPQRKKLIAGIEHIVRPAKPTAPEPIATAKAIPIVLPATVPTFTTRESYFLPLPGSPPVDLADMEGGKCHWPVNGLYGREPIYCGRPADGTYCRVHTRLAYEPAQTPKETRHGASA
ncbi:GcrA family cell cycle regulator [Mesorhizobium sp.]|uniref:GcrA family cell cycle regulator n=1 Tax=Mesorhizobium sp. TaxID=1871066 RepID=UPI000FE9F329|nr:GcrA family cell cycle regulator [Mesorhizobium sp.]RWM29445.1 MAG: hypothetical protein EOR74_07130 [Mesorhizobium sp.]